MEMKYILPVIAPRNNMIKATLNLDPQLPRHTRES
jgi:hypothetical protein